MAVTAVTAVAIVAGTAMPAISRGTPYFSGFAAGARAVGRRSRLRCVRRAALPVLPPYVGGTHKPISHTYHGLVGVRGSFLHRFCIGSGGQIPWGLAS